MGQSFRTRVIILGVFLSLTSIFVYWNPSLNASKKSQCLRDAIKHIGGWKIAGSFDLAKDVVKTLDLDDYVNERLVNGESEVLLYIGYYYTNKKVGVAHSPLVCYPGQGWQLSRKEETTIRVGGENINLAKMIASRGDMRYFVFYWFQAYDATSAGTLRQKLNCLWARLVNRNENNAFVRISIPIGDESVDVGVSRGVEFIRNFYPIFLEYVVDKRER
jgi:EpsI family protein